MPILFYCKDCQRVVEDPIKSSQGYIYQCPICKGDRVSFGTKTSICEYFQIKEAALAKMLNPSQ